MTQQPSPTPYEQLLAAVETTLHMAGHIAPADLPSGAEQSAQLAFGKAGLPDVIGVVLRGIPSVDALDRIKTVFGGTVTVTRRASSAPGTQWTEHQLVGIVRDGAGLEVPFLARAETDHEPLLPLPRRRRAATLPDMVRVPVTQLDDGGRAAERAALDLVTASLARDVEPGALEYAHYVLHPEPDPGTLACLLAHTDLQPDDPTLTTAHATGPAAVCRAHGDDCTRDPYETHILAQATTADAGRGDDL